MTHHTQTKNDGQAVAATSGIMSKSEILSELPRFDGFSSTYIRADFDRGEITLSFPPVKFHPRGRLVSVGPAGRKKAMSELGEYRATLSSSCLAY